MEVGREDSTGDVKEYEHSFVYDTTAGIPAVIEESTPSGVVYYIREPEGSLIARVAGTSTHYYHFDALGSTRLLTDGSGTVTDKYAYDAYGALLAHDGSVGQPYQYVGQLGYYTDWQEPDFGLMQLGVRFYDEQLGRFASRDTIGGDRHSTYLYVDGEPTSAVDYDGRAKYKIPIRGVSSFKICYRNLVGTCVRHSYLLIDGVPIGYGPGGVGRIRGDVEDLENGRANCIALRYLKTDQMSCLRGLLSGRTQVPGDWRRGTMYFRNDGPGHYCPKVHDCFDWTRVALEACGLSGSIVTGRNARLSPW